MTPNPGAPTMESRVTKAEREKFAEIGAQMVAAVADTNRLRETEPYPQPKWREAWNRRTDLLAQFVDAAQKIAGTATIHPDAPADTGGEAGRGDRG